MKSSQKEIHLTRNYPTNPKEEQGRLQANNSHPQNTYCCNSVASLLCTNPPKRLQLLSLFLWEVHSHTIRCQHTTKENTTGFVARILFYFVLIFLHTILVYYGKGGNVTFSTTATSKLYLQNDSLLNRSVSEFF